MEPFANNQELSEYLSELAALLENRGAEELSYDVRVAMAQAAMMTTEFLGESRSALRRVADQEAGMLTPGERAGLLRALQQLDNAFAGRSHRLVPPRTT